MSLASALYIVPTPIGNLGDMTQRAIEVLTAADLIAAEDTRHSRRLLDAYSISGHLWSLHEHNERARSAAIIERVQAGQIVALISDAGTPLISDPGYPLLRACRDAGVNVIPLPGACAAITALSAAGLPTDRFSFEGFLPAKSGALNSRLDGLAKEPRTMVFYESPRRVLVTLTAMIEHFGAEREATLAKELTKRFESVVQSTLAGLIDWLEAEPERQQGEFVLVIGGYQVPEGEGLPAEAERWLTLLIAELPLKKAAALVAEMYDVKKKLVYDLGLKLQGR
ncbi:16S rRNA (cytidine(1402)-2'-O)-methyltransferase [Corallincola luteus]|uniref:Ribosomal RNA small subunit methyltransferase I n=1 Tax=Corallincola luteus TaxID=1775177 RepID=A0ABY2AKY2_9GAMM|nr:16S rRNA (cytidine(1402)-2'-O)-methyltransferase [Corallincola luteus]TCI03578.1 16S rRNA (cytidine(1402)-2'-O)-methyltransferase [Corallincola luteus]